MESIQTLTPEESLTATMSILLAQEPWVEGRYEDNVTSSRTTIIELPDGRKLSLTQHCKVEDLGWWENSVKILNAEGRVTVNAVWLRDEENVEGLDYLEGILSSIVQGRDESTEDVQ
jgi:hypothetical protein